MGPVRRSQAHGDDPDSGHVVLLTIAEREYSPAQLPCTRAPFGLPPDLRNAPPPRRPKGPFLGLPQVLRRPPPPRGRKGGGGALGVNGTAPAPAVAACAPRSPGPSARRAHRVRTPGCGRRTRRPARPRRCPTPP